MQIGTGTTPLGSSPSVSVVIPTLDEAAHIDECLASVRGQRYPNVTEVLVVDGRSTDDTRSRAAAHAGVRVLDNPRRIQAAALNIGLAASNGDVVVRVDGHCVLAPDYVERCVDALELTGASMVGGPMRPRGHRWGQRGIAAAMASRLGAGPARFHRPGFSGWVDTVYLGAYRRRDALEAGGYAEDVSVNEDAEFAIRMRRIGGVYLDERIRSTYVPRDDFLRLGRQFYRYGRARAATVRRHPGELAARQLVAPALVAALLSPLRRPVAAAYLGAVAGAAFPVAARDPGAGIAFALALPIMHLAWGVGFLVGQVASPPHAPTDAVHLAEGSPRERAAGGVLGP